MPEAVPVPNMPTFTVLIPHYSEKIILSLREIIREEGRNTKITLLEYLKHLHAFEWENFVKDTKVLADEALYLPDEEKSDAKVVNVRNLSSITQLHSQSISSAIADEKTETKHKIDDLPFYCVGFKSAAPEYTIRTRIWASLRSQTLYRTISGFMNYQKAIKLLYRVETPDLPNIQSSPSTNHNLTDLELDQMAKRKFKFVIAMQRYSSFNKEEKENVEYIMKAYPDLQIAYLEQESLTIEDTNDNDIKKENAFYSVLIDGNCPISHDGRRSPKYRIRLPGNPILGDGKSDNQNTALIYYRGEYLQLIDANQDNYLEECIKIRSVLGEFEETTPPDRSPYAQTESNKSPVAIVGAREYIFSENVGILGDVAAGKEQTFGTLTQRIMATIGGRLHYGHPDILNATFMTTRGGVSKAQKGLHLNEDIYAGMNAFQRGGRIKHVEYFQCGKGRDLGFGSVLNFVTKIGSGMGEQMLSREYYYLGTQLPLDRFLTFYYAHPGFHINNIFIMFSIHTFILMLFFVGATSMPLTLCETDNSTSETVLTSEECYNFTPIYEWLKRVMISIFSVISVSFLPLFLQETTEKGLFRAFSRLCKHMLSLSPFFEIFVTQTYTNAILNNLTFGGAKYIGTGRGIATTRLSFPLLYSRFADVSMYAGARLALILLFGSTVLWMPHLLYFWMTVLALIISPFVFNPHQFALIDFLYDYREYIRWLCRGNGKSHNNSWIGHCRSIRLRTTGIKKKQLEDSCKSNQAFHSKSRFMAVFFSELLVPFILATLCVFAYVYFHSFESANSIRLSHQSNTLLRILAISFGPILLNAGILVILFFVSLFGGCIASCCCGVKFGSTIAAVAHGWAVLNLIAFFELLYFLENWQFPSLLLGIIAAGFVQRFIIKLMTVALLTRELGEGQTNQAWWTGRWYGRNFGWYALSQPYREYVYKWHSLMLFWLRPKDQIQEPVYSSIERSKRRKVATMYGFLLISLFTAFLGLVVAPAIIKPQLKFKIPLLM
ncbi:hypothetical protein G6F35_001980 [Rhizopus arrhizus]|nr:hypothetical protein G6F35_001980 [Rhizopus arrhizus]